MISIVCGTNRKGSNSLIFSRLIEGMVTGSGIPCQILDLADLPSNFIFENEVFGIGDAPVNAISEEYISGADKFIFVVPEYNGSFPGVLKGFIDSFKPERIKGKKALLIGISSGRAGNLRGLDHLTGVLNYLNVEVLPTKLAISKCHQLIDFDAQVVNDQGTIELVKTQVEKLTTS